MLVLQATFNEEFTASVNIIHSLYSWDFRSGIYILVVNNLTIFSFRDYLQVL